MHVCNSIGPKALCVLCNGTFNFSVPSIFGLNCYVITVGTIWYAMLLGFEDNPGAMGLYYLAKGGHSGVVMCKGLVFASPTPYHTALALLQRHTYAQQPIRVGGDT